MTNPWMKRDLDIGFEAAVEKLPATLATEGFGVLSEIDVQGTLKKKLGADIRKYRIFGACNPAFAQRALSSLTDIGVMLPCNVVIYERDDGKATMLAIDPQVTMTLVDQAGVKELAAEVRGKLAKVVERMGD